MRAARIAWCFAALSAVCAIGDTIFSAKHAPLFSQQEWLEHGWPVVPLTTLGAAVMGALIVSRYPRHPVGWLLVIAGFSSVAVVGEAYTYWAFADGGHGPQTFAHVVGWVGALFGAVFGITAVKLIFLIAPNGRLLSPIWRWVVAAALVGYALFVVAVLIQSPATYEVSQLHVSHADHELHAVAHYLMNGTLALAALGIGIRLTRERGAARRQLLWIAPSALLLTGTFFWLQYGEHFNSHRDTLLSVSLLYAAYASVPICTAVAVLRYGLFDIELVVNRALVFFFATAFAACAYVLIVVALGSAVNDQTSFWPSLLATAVVAIAFQPLRQRAVRLADRLAYGAAAEPYDALADFSRRLGETPDPTDLLPAMADAAKGAVGARHATVELFMPSGLVETATAGGAALDAGSTTEIPIVDDGDRVGLLTVEMAPGRGLRPQDLTLLHDLIAQAVVAFRNARLSAELMHRVADLDRQATALEESRRRLIRAADAERMRLQRALNRDVAPRLATMPQRLEGLARGGAGAVIAERVQPLRLDAEHALDDLREITRGVYPAQLGRSGLVPALRSLLARTPNAQFTADADPDDPRVDARVEATAYYCVAEAIRGMTGPVEVVLVQQHEEVVVNVSGASAGDVSVDHMRDRVEAAAGSLAFWRTDERWMVEVRLPIPKLVGVGIGD